MLQTINAIHVCCGHGVSFLFFSFFFFFFFFFVCLFVLGVFLVFFFFYDIDLHADLLCFPSLAPVGDWAAL